MTPGITILGLGPGRPEEITREVWQILESSQEVYLRTVRHPCVPALPDKPRYHSFDDVYERLDAFAQVYETIAQTVLQLGRREAGVVYAVPGHPLMGETSVLRVLELARQEGLPVRIISGLSFLEPTMVALGRDAFDGLQICDATILAQKHHPSIDPDVATLVVQVYDRHLASDLKITLMNLYHDDQPITLVIAAGTKHEVVRDIPLYELDRQDDLDHLTSVFIAPLDRPGSLSSYQDVVARLRAPGGCPWDREQTHASLRTYLLEETYEVLAAIDADDMDALKEELGDLLLQILLHAQIATEDGDFRLIDTTRFVIEKMVRRHPHVFGGQKVADSTEVLRNWEQIKRQERQERQAHHGAEIPPKSLLSGIPKALPALARAMEVQRRAARVGFDWREIEPVLAKVNEELQELDQATTGEERAAEFGDLLFSLVNVARWEKIDAESALRESVARFTRRFATIEERAMRQGRSLEDMSLEEMDAIWEQAKQEEQVTLPDAEQSMS